MFFIVTVTNRIPVFFSGKPNKYRFGEQSLGPKRREAKATQIESIQRKLSNDRAEVILLGDSIIKNIERFAPKYFTFFPASTVLNAGIPGDTVEAILYSAPHVFSLNCYLHFSSMWNQQSIFSLTSHHLCNCNGDFICIAPKMSNLCHSFIS